MNVAKIPGLAALLLLAAAASAQQGGDLQAQILYAYQTEDGNSLSNLIQDLATQAQGGGGRCLAALSPGPCAVSPRIAVGHPQRPRGGILIFRLHRSTQAIAVARRKVGGNLDSAVRLLRRTCRPPDSGVGAAAIAFGRTAEVRAQTGAAQSARRFSFQPGGTAPSQTRHAAAAAGILAAAACRTTVRLELGDQHRRSGLGTCRGVSGPRPRAAGARRSIGRPQLDREVLDRRAGLQGGATPDGTFGAATFLGASADGRSGGPQPGMIRRDEATRHAVIAV